MVARCSESPVRFERLWSTIRPFAKVVLLEDLLLNGPPERMFNTGPGGEDQSVLLVVIEPRSAEELQVCRGTEVVLNEDPGDEPPVGLDRGGGVVVVRLVAEARTREEIVPLAAPPVPDQVAEKDVLVGCVRGVPVVAVLIVPGVGNRAPASF